MPMAKEKDSLEYTEMRFFLKNATISMVGEMGYIDYGTIMDNSAVSAIMCLAKKKEFLKDGQLRNEWNYVNNKREGISRPWYENGQLCEECNYVNGESEGIYRSWHENGQFHCECNCVNGKQEGNRLLWYENGQLRGECNYVNDKKDGSSKKWYKNGQIEEDEFYCDGVLVSRIAYDEDGKVINQISSRAKSARS
jgi:antitoxin component YwqK of YwqJK toxin-antitoxin module